MENRIGDNATITLILRELQEMDDDISIYLLAESNHEVYYPEKIVFFDGCEEAYFSMLKSDNKEEYEKLDQIGYYDYTPHAWAELIWRKWDDGSLPRTQRKD